MINQFFGQVTTLHPEDYTSFTFNRGWLQGDKIIQNDPESRITPKVFKIVQYYSLPLQNDHMIFKSLLNYKLLFS